MVRRARAARSAPVPAPAYIRRRLAWFDPLDEAQLARLDAQVAEARVRPQRVVARLGDALKEAHDAALQVQEGGVQDAGAAVGALGDGREHARSALIHQFA